MMLQNCHSARGGWVSPCSIPSRTAALLLAAACLLSATLFIPVASAQSQVPAGTRFLVELRDRLDAKKVHRGKKFEARTLEAIQTSDGQVIPAGARLRGRVGHVSKKDMQLHIEEIDTQWGNLPLAAEVVEVVGEKDVKGRTDDEGDIKASGGHAKSAAVGGLVGAGVGAAAGDAAAGGGGAEKGAVLGGAAGILLGAARGGHRLVLNEGTRLEVELERPLTLVANR